MTFSEMFHNSTSSALEVYRSVTSIPHHRINPPPEFFNDFKDRVTFVTFVREQSLHAFQTVEILRYRFVRTITDLYGSFRALRYMTTYMRTGCVLCSLHQIGGAQTDGPRQGTPPRRARRLCGAAPRAGRQLPGDCCGERPRPSLGSARSNHAASLERGLQCRTFRTRSLAITPATPNSNRVPRPRLRGMMTPTSTCWTP